MGRLTRIIALFITLAVFTLAAVSVTPAYAEGQSDFARLSPTYKWYAVESATRYYVVVLDSAGKIVFMTSVEAADACRDNICEVKQDSRLEYATYTWYVAGENAAGMGPFSDGMHFTIRAVTPAPTPQLAPTFQP